jgi:acyl-CoA synthetase (NDP forming)/RimJ/RimL family protein N-acetyltransferase
MAREVTARDVILRDGSTLRLRPPERGDEEALVAFLAGLSEASRRMRFHAAVHAEPTLVRPYLEPDWSESGGLVGELDGGDGPRVVAHATWSRLRDPERAEVAFAVADDVQGRGIGTRLLEQLAETAGDAGVREFVAEVLPENTAMLAVFRDAGFEVVRTSEGGTVEIRFPIAATERYLASREERDHAAVVASLRPFFEPRSVAVAGASPRRGTIGGELFRNIVAGGFTGAAYPVNRRGQAVAGMDGYSTFAELPETPDLVMVTVPAEAVHAVVEDALERGTRALCVITAGFAELGAEGAARERELVALVRSYGARLIGPNCLGISVAGPRLNATFAPRAFPPGGIGFSSQSGALGLALLEEAEPAGLGFSAFVSIGNKADVSSNDLLEWWEDDDDTELVLLYLEAFGNPRKFGRLAPRVSRRKPVLAVKSGVTKTGARAAGSHTAALAGSEAAAEALFHQAGVLRAGTLEELVDLAGLLVRQPLPTGRRVAVLTNAGGLGILCADACESAGLTLAGLGDETQAALAAEVPPEASLANPVDLLGSARLETYAAALPLLLGATGVDAVIVISVPTVALAAADVHSWLAELEQGSKPALGVVMGVRGPAGRVPAFGYPESAARALGRAAERADWLRRPAGTVPEPEGLDREGARALVEKQLAEGGEGWLSAEGTRALLSAYRIPLVAERVASSPEEAVAAARELGFPAVVKSAAPGAHKTETGGVALDLTSEEEVRAAAARIGPPVLVQPMLSGGPELLAGLVQDPVFGALVAFGPGGVLAELIGDAGFRIAPLTDLDAAELVAGGKAGRLVAGFRGRPPADPASLRELLHRLSALGTDLPEVAELDLNPVLGLPDGCVALDARVRVSEPVRPLRTKTW